MKKERALLLAGLFFLWKSTGSFGQLSEIPANQSQSFVMGCYYKKYSHDSINVRFKYDYIKDYRTCRACRMSYENNKIVQKVYDAQRTQESLPFNNAKRGPDYYRYYRSVISRRYSRTAAGILDAL